MKYDPGKTYPWPVLRPGGPDKDYPRAEFEAEIDVDRLNGRTAVRASATFALSDRDLLGLVEEGNARYVLLVSAPATHHRSAHVSAGPPITAEFANGALAGRTEFRGLLVAVRPVSGFRAAGWHADYAGRSYDIEAGGVLAEDEPEDYWIDNAEETPIGSIFEVQAGGADSGRWRCDLDGDRVQLRMSPEDYGRFEAARSLVNAKPEAANVMNGVYLPALVHVLETADRGEDLHEDRRWYRALNERLRDRSLPLLGSAAAHDRLADAQRLLEEPFGEALALWAGEAP